MKSKCFLLLKGQLSGQLRRRGRQKSETMVMVGMVVLGAVLCIYSFMIAMGMGAIGMANVIPAYAVAITGIISIVFTALKANGILFAYKDFDILMSLPVKTSTVIASRFLTMYVMNLLFTALVMIPMGAGYVINTDAGVLFYPLWLLGIFTAPLIPTTIATLLGAVIIFISSRFRHANAVTTILSIAVVVVVLIGSFVLGSVGNQEMNTTQLARVGDMIFQQVHRMYPPSVLFERAIVESSVISFAVFAGVSVVWYWVFVKLISLRYKKMNTGLTTHRTRSDYRLTALKETSPVKSLFFKEAKRFFTCPVYTMNMGMGVIMALLFSAACCIVGESKIEVILQVPGLSNILVPILPFALAALLCMVCTSCVSLSLEGKNLWILKSLPLHPKTIYQSKMLFNLALQVPAGLICSLLLALRISFSPVMLVMLFVTPAVYAAFCTVLGMYVNLKMPNYQWTSETAVVKNSMAAMVGIFGGMLNGAVPIIVIFLLRGSYTEIVTVVFTALEGVFALLLYRHVCTLKF